MDQSESNDFVDSDSILKIYVLQQRMVEEALIHDDLNVVVVDWVGGTLSFSILTLIRNI